MEIEQELNFTGTFPVKFVIVMEQVLQNIDMVVEIGRGGLELWGGNWPLVCKGFAEANDQYKRQIGCRRNGEVAKMHNLNESYFWEYEPYFQNGDFVYLVDGNTMKAGIYLVIPYGMCTEGEGKVRVIQCGGRRRSLLNIGACSSTYKNESGEIKRCYMIRKLPKLILPLIQDPHSFYENPYVPTEREARNLFYRKHYTLEKSSFKHVTGFSSIYWCRDLCVFAYTNRETYDRQEDDDTNVNGIIN